MTPLSQRLRGVANTFSAEEVEAMVRLFRKLDTPASRELLTPEVRRAQGRFLRMQAALERARVEANEPT